MKRKAVIIIIIIVVIILMAVSAWLIYKKLFKKDGGTGEEFIPFPDPNAGGGYSPASFPVKKGMSGPIVIDIQNAINKKCNAGLTPDGAFGPMTEAALKSCYAGITEVSQAVYTQMKIDASAAPSSQCPKGMIPDPSYGCIMAGAGKTTTPTGFQPGDKVYARTLGQTLLYKIPSANSESVGYIQVGVTSQNCGGKNVVYTCMHLPIGTYISDSVEGFSKIRVEANHLYDAGFLAGNQWTTTPHEFYIRTSLIKK